MILYFDCFSGAAGDMLLGALVDAGAPPGVVRESIDALGLDGWSLEFESTTRTGLRATKANVTVHDGSVSRSYRDIVALLDRASLSEVVRCTASETFDLLARAEARVHGIEPREVHFHEVGSLDAIVDVVGCCAAMAHLAPERVVTSPIATGTGTVSSAHGTLPLPAPAVTEILAAAGATLFERGHSELVTPTGAALLATFSDSFGPLPAMALERVGYGAGSHTHEIPNVLRVLVGRTPSTTEASDAVLVEANLDDMSPELVPHLMERLLEAGAHDAWVVPILMKKGRPAYTICALVGPERRPDVAAVLFEETTTFGLRWSSAIKEVLERRWVEVEVDSEPIRVKVAERAGRVATLAPEHDDARAAARALGRPLREVYARALEAARFLLKD